MKVDLRALRAERGGTLDVEYREIIASRIEEIPFTGPVEGVLTLTNLGAVLRVDGRMHTIARLTCDRCASPFDHRVRAVIEEELDWNAVTGPGQRDEGEEAYLFHAGDSVFLDVDALARDALVLALPMVVRCSADCRGLCPRCGAKLGAEPCRCASEPGDPGAVDPRFASLTGWQGGRSSSGSAS